MSLPTLNMRRPDQSPHMGGFHSPNITNTGTRTASGHIKERRPAEYDGRSSWLDYQCQFELIAELNEWNDNIKAMQLASSLRGDAQSILSDLPLRKEKIYSDLCSI